MEKKYKLGETRFGNKPMKDERKTAKGVKEFVDYNIVGKTNFMPPKTALDKKIKPVKEKVW